MKSKFKILLLTLTIFLSGCHSVKVITDPLPIPDKLIIPASMKISNSEWDCITSNKEDRVKCSAYQKLGKQVKLRNARIATLRNTILSTHKAEK